MLCGDQALDFLKSLIKINETKVHLSIMLESKTKIFGVTGL